jgi:DnaJ-class molecular chaperone
MCGGSGHSTGNVILDWLFHLVVMWNPKTWVYVYKAMGQGDKDADTAFRKQWPKCLACDGEGKVRTTCDYCSGQGHVRL